MSVISALYTQPIIALSAVDCGLEPRSGQTKDYEIVAFPLSTQHKEKEQKLVGLESG